MIRVLVVMLWVGSLYITYQWGAGEGWGHGFKFGLSRWEDSYKHCLKYWSRTEKETVECIEDGINREYRVIGVPPVL